MRWSPSTSVVILGKRFSRTRSRARSAICCRNASPLGVGRRLDQRLRVQALIPDVQRPQPRALAQVLPIRAHARQDRALTGGVGQAIVPRRDLEAHDQALQVPFPRCRERLVEVVEVEDQIPLGRGERTEVQQVAVAARLHLDAGGRQGGEVVRHQSRRAAQEGERSSDHASVADRHQFRQSPSIRLLQDLDRIPSLSRRAPVPVALPRNAFAQGLAGREPLGADVEAGEPFRLALRGRGFPRSFGRCRHGGIVGPHRCPCNRRGRDGSPDRRRCVRPCARCRNRAGSGTGGRPA